MDHMGWFANSNTFFTLAILQMLNTSSMCKTNWYQDTAHYKAETTNTNNKV